MKFKALLLIVGFAPVMVMAQAKPATPSSIEKPIAVNPSERMYHPKIEDKKAEVKTEVTAKVQAGGINVPVVINPLPGPSGTPKQTQAGDEPLSTSEPLCMLYPESCGRRPDIINVPLGQAEGTKPSEDTQTDTVIFNVNDIQHNITHGYQPIIKP